MKNFNKTILATALMTLAGNVSAAGFLLNETSVSGLGRAFAGEGATADDAAVLARNPAAMALFDKTSLSLVGTYIDPGVDMQGVTNPLNPTDPSSLNIDGAAPEAFIPAAYLIHPLNDKVAVGVAAYSNFGLGTDFGEAYDAGSIGGKTEILTMNLNASVSYRLNAHWSVGAGFNAVYGDAELIRNLGALATPLNSQLPPGLNTLEPSSDLANMSGDGWGYGFNVGVLYELNDNHRLALTYKSQTTVELEGKYSNALPQGLQLDEYTKGTAGDSVSGTLDVELPDLIEFSGYHKLNDQLVLHTTVMWSGWSAFEEIRAVASEDVTFSGGICGLDPRGCSISSGDTILLKEENFEDAWRFGLGATYLVSPEVTLRAGIAYDETPVPETHRSISIPDSDRIWYSFGANYRLSDSADIDLAFSFIDGEEVTVNEDGFVLNSEGNAILIGAQFNYAF